MGNCGMRSKNPIVSCTCADGESWTKPEKGDRPAKKDRPCGKGRNIESCVCADGETYEGRAVRRNCKKDDSQQQNVHARMEANGPPKRKILKKKKKKTKIKACVSQKKFPVLYV